ncbi:metallophosphoesterase family protein [Nannocystis bainbridge]|uniref:Metallophosphoesterase n=1 Tax=Nannocystis bainbridge TaxID=2995303 RepID=A0ABT5DZF7_9BACT|nr:metallophosphoesterase [Nannocystis bainbridge]MDC0718980.1 metallophosphoesterase [Nannocystis bainbridge]
MKLWALSDLHVGHRRNRELLVHLSPKPDDWLIVGGDIGETGDHMQWAFDLLQPRFARLLWVPGNHELWTSEERGVRLGGADKLAALGELCRARGVVGVDDEWPVWPGDGGPHTIALLALLYDYGFAPPGLDRAGAIAWAAEDGVVAADESRLDPAPFPDIAAWSAARVSTAAARLERSQAHPTVLVNHWPLRDDLIFIPRVPRYRPWCGTLATHDWHRRYGARVVVSGHLHTRRTDWIDGVRFEECSLGYPREQRSGMLADAYLRQILPEPTVLHHAPR